MSKVNLENGVVFIVEEKIFQKKELGKLFTSKTYDGCLSQAEHHKKQCSLDNEPRDSFERVYIDGVESQYYWHKGRNWLVQEHQGSFIRTKTNKFNNRTLMTFNNIQGYKNLEEEISRLTLSIHDLHDKRESLISRRNSMVLDVKEF